MTTPEKHEWENRAVDLICQFTSEPDQIHTATIIIGRIVNKELTTYRTKLIEEVEKMRRLYPHEECRDGKSQICYVCASILTYNQAIDDILTIIKDTEVKK